jgi:quinol monooxygenase YgiN
VWAQLITFRVHPGTTARVKDMVDHLIATEQPDSGLILEMGMSDQRDPTSVHVLAVFESEEKARAREQDPRRAEAQETIRAMMGEVLAGPPQFIDLQVVAEGTLPSHQA